MPLHNNDNMTVSSSLFAEKATSTHLPEWALFQVTNKSVEEKKREQK